MARKPREIPKRARATKAASKPAKKSLSKKGAATTTGFKNPREVSDAVFRFMCEEHAYGVTEWTRAELASAVGFGNPKTEKFAKGLKNLVSHEGLAESGATGGTLVLSALGIARKPTEKTPATLGDLHNRFLERLAQKCKGGTDKLPAVWDILKDRKEHSIASVAQKLGYKNPKSFGNTKIIATMRAMGLVENGSGRGTVQMTEKAFPSNLCN